MSEANVSLEDIAKTIKEAVPTGRGSEMIPGKIFLDAAKTAGIAVSKIQEENIINNRIDFKFERNRLRKMTGRKLENAARKALSVAERFDEIIK